ncbi:MAG: phosphatase PAP2 family protein [Nocardioides sp.]
MSRERSVGSPLGRILLTGLSCAAGFGLVYVVTVRTVPGRRFGDASLRGALLTRSTMADSATTVLDVVSVASLLGAVALVAVIALVRLLRVQGLAAIGLLVGANASTWVLKRYLLERPDLGLVEVSPATLNSLPSGHTTAVFSAVVALLFVVPLRWRSPTALTGLVAATATALATMSAGWHRAGDSMASFLLVGVWAAVAAAAVVTLDPADDPAERGSVPWPGPTRWLVVISATSVALGLMLGAALVSAGSLRDATVGSGIAVLASGLLIAGTGIAVTLGVLGIVPRESSGNGT